MRPGQLSDNSHRPLPQLPPIPLRRIPARLKPADTLGLQPPRAILGTVDTPGRAHSKGA